MHREILAATVAKVRQRASEGDCPITAPFSVEHLETAVIDLAAALRARMSEPVDKVERMIAGLETPEPGSWDDGALLNHRTMEYRTSEPEAGEAWGTKAGIPDGEPVEVRERDGTVSRMIVGSRQWNVMLRDLGQNVAVRRTRQSPATADKLRERYAYVGVMVEKAINEGASYSDIAAIARQALATLSPKEEGGE